MARSIGRGKEFVAVDTNGDRRIVVHKLTGNARPLMSNDGAQVGIVSNNAVIKDISSEMQMKMERVGGEFITVMKCSEFAMSYSLTAAQAANLSVGFLAALPISPTSPYLPRLALAARTYERYRIRRIVAEWAPSCPSTSGGSFAMGFSADPDLSLQAATSTNFIRAITETSGGVVFNTFSPATSAISLDIDTNWRYVYDSPDEDQRWSIPAVLYLGVVAPPLVVGTGTQPYGSVTIGYDVEFAFPKLVEVEQTYATPGDVTFSQGTGALPAVGSNPVVTDASGDTGSITFHCTINLDENYIYALRWLSTTTAPVFSAGSMVCGSDGIHSSWSETSASTANPIVMGQIYLKKNPAKDEFFMYESSDCSDYSRLQVMTTGTLTTGAVYVFSIFAYSRVHA